MVIRVESLGLNFQHMESLREDSSIQDCWLSSLPNLLSDIFCRLSLKILAGLFRTNSYWQKSTSLKNRNDILLVASTGASRAGESLGCTVRFRKLSQVVSFLNICSSRVYSGVLGGRGLLPASNSLSTIEVQVRASNSYPSCSLIEKSE